MWRFGGAIAAMMSVPWFAFAQTMPAASAREFVPPTVTQIVGKTVETFYQVGQWNELNPSANTPWTIAKHILEAQRMANELAAGPITDSAIQKLSQTLVPEGFLRAGRVLDLSDYLKSMDAQQVFQALHPNAYHVTSSVLPSLQTTLNPISIAPPDITLALTDFVPRLPEFIDPWLAVATCVAIVAVVVLMGIAVHGIREFQHSQRSFTMEPEGDLPPVAKWEIARPRRRLTAREANDVLEQMAQVDIHQPGWRLEVERLQRKLYDWFPSQWSGVIGPYPRFLPKSRTRIVRSSS